MIENDPDGNYIKAIKRYRELFGASLKESKDAVDKIKYGTW